MTEIQFGAPSEKLAIYADRHVYKHLVDEMNIDIAECYSVCEEKEAEMPSERTSANLPDTIRSIKGGYTSGDLDVPVTGNITGVDACGYSVTGNIAGNVMGSICGDVQGYVNNVSGVLGRVEEICGDVGSDWTCGRQVIGGNVCGSIYGGVCGDIGSDVNHTGVCGSIYGGVCGMICGSVGCGCGTAVDYVNGSVGYGGVYGDVNNSVCGNIYGSVGGMICGSVGCGCGTAICGYVYGDIGSDMNYADVCGNIYGSVGGMICGSINSGVCGDIYGQGEIPFGINGTIYPYYSFSSAYIDTDSTCGAFAICGGGTTWWVHLV